MNKTCFHLGLQRLSEHSGFSAAFHGDEESLLFYAAVGLYTEATARLQRQRECKIDVRELLLKGTYFFTLFYFD